MKKIKIFLASSNELKAERELFEMRINRKNKEWVSKGTYLHLDIWEDLSARMFSGGSQNEYNKFVRAADLFVVLVNTKVGEHTLTEFENAFRQFESTQRPFIYIYLKNNSEKIEDSRSQFLEKIHKLKHFYSTFNDAGELWLKYDDELDRLDIGKIGLNNKKGFNEILTRNLMEALKDHNSTARIFVDKANKESSDWEAQTKFSTPAKFIITENFVGVLGIQLSKLLAIGKIDSSESIRRTYLENVQIVVKRALQLLCFSLISKLWDYQKENFHELSSNNAESLTNFFESSFDFDIQDYVSLLKNLVEIFHQQKLKYPLSDESTYLQLIENDGEFISACFKIHDISNILSENFFTDLTCFEAEKELTIVMGKLIFLAEHKMISMKGILYDAMRNSPPHYLHKYADLGMKGKNMNYPSIRNFADYSVTTETIFLFTKDYRESINLFPFVIDYNALTFEPGSKIYFYSHNGIGDENLYYTFVEDNSFQIIEDKKIPNIYSDINAIINNKELRKQMKLDSVNLEFKAAGKTILGK